MGRNKTKLLTALAIAIPILFAVSFRFVGLYRDVSRAGSKEATQDRATAARSESDGQVTPDSSRSLPSPDSNVASRILEGARREAERETLYMETYEVIPYPGGDVSPEIGVCTDLVVRAFRNAGVDLQQRLHEDRKSHPEAYPTHLWEYKKPDRNIDHRRCQNLYVFFTRHAKERPVSLEAEHRADWKAGDVVFFRRQGREFPWHVAIVSDNTASDGSPMIYHLYAPRASEVSITPFLPIHSRFRWPVSGSGQ